MTVITVSEWRLKKTNLRGMEALAVLVEDSGSVSSTY